jgi:hypothetical protein
MSAATVKTNTPSMTANRPMPDQRRNLATVPRRRAGRFRSAPPVAALARQRPETEIEDR